MLYPLIMTLSAQSNFRLSATLTEKVEPEILLAALKKTYERYYMFKVELNNGLFRSCFVENFDEPKIYVDNGVALGRIKVNTNRGFLIKVSYYKKSVYAEFFHGLTDGTGAAEFFGFLLSAYVSLSHNVDINEFYPKKDGEDEDAYDKYYGSKTKKNLLSAINKNAAQVKGKFFIHEGLGVISGQCGFSGIKALAKEYGCSVTALLGAFALNAAVNTLVKKSDNAPSVMFPVNLRRFFPSETLLNFVCMENVRVENAENNPRAYAEQIGEKLKGSLNIDELSHAINVTSTVARNPAVRFLPAFLKRFFIVAGRFFVSSTKQTLIVSNLGEFKLPDVVTPYVDDVEFLLNCNERTPLNLGVVSYKGNLRMSFSRHIVETDVERKFFESLREVGVDCKVRSNYRENR